MGFFESFFFLGEFLAIFLTLDQFVEINVNALTGYQNF